MTYETKIPNILQYYGTRLSKDEKTLDYLKSTAFWFKKQCIWEKARRFGGTYRGTTAWCLIQHRE
jgi:hypothetical protein